MRLVRGAEPRSWADASVVALVIPAAVVDDELGRSERSSDELLNGAGRL